MTLSIIENPNVYHIQLIHPDYGSEFHTVAVSDGDLPLFASDEEWSEYNRELIKVLKKRYNNYGYWHEMIVTAEIVFDNKVYHREIKEEE